MQSPCTTRSAVKTPRSGATARSEVGIESRPRLRSTPSLRLILRLKKATARPPAAMPKVDALTASPIAAGDTS